MFQPVKTAWGEYLQRWYAQIKPTTKGMSEFAGRGFAQSVAWSPCRLVDQAEEIISLWNRANVVGNTATQPPKLPAMVCAMDKSYMPTSRDYTQEVTVPEWITLPQDTKERAFKIMTAAEDLRLQTVIMSQDEPTARAIATQLRQWITAPNHRFIPATYVFAGFHNIFPVHIQTPEIQVMDAKGATHNLSVLFIDLTLRAHVPTFLHPADGDPDADGKGTDGDPNDPHGYLTVEVVNKNERF